MVEFLKPAMTSTAQGMTLHWELLWLGSPSLSAVVLQMWSAPAKSAVVPPQTPPGQWLLAGGDVDLPF